MTDGPEPAGLEDRVSDRRSIRLKPAFGWQARDRRRMTMRIDQEVPLCSRGQV